jgi:hypothetical protein
MSINPNTSGTPTPRPLSERVQERVITAAAHLPSDERRGSKSGPRDGADIPRDVRALHRVFRDMGRSQRTARQQTGQAPSPVVREAALAFRRAPSLESLVLVAASLDEIGLLAW